jgi:hypothetical protein
MLSCSAKRSCRRGIVAPFVALCLVGVLGVAALAIDGGLLLANRRQAQAIADAAAMAAAIDLFDNWPTYSGKDTGGTATSSAQDTATDNFPKGASVTFKKNLAPPYTGLTGYTVVVNIPPQSGPYTGLASYAEVIVGMPQPRFFSNLFGSGNLNVQARAVALGSKAPPGIGILVLNPSHSNTLQMSATGNVTVSGGTIVVDSSDPAALHLSATGSVTASEVYLTGSTYSTTSSGTVNGLQSPSTGSTIFANKAATVDPLATWAKSNTPSSSGTTMYSNVQISGAIPTTNQTYGNITARDSKGNPTQFTFNPGYYSGGLTINDNTPGHTYVLGSGVYYFDQNVTLNGYGTVQSGPGGTLLYMAKGSLTNSSQNMTLNLSPMTSGTYSDPAIALWSDANNSSGVNFSAGGYLTIASGIIYAPNTSATVQFSAKAGSTAQLGSQVIVGNLALTASGSFNVNVGSSMAPGRQLYLVE